jgi:hypothetical protein
MVSVALLEPPTPRVGLYYTLKALNLLQAARLVTTPITIHDIINVILLAGLKPCLSISTIPIR